MLLSLDWLKEFVKLPNSLAPQDLAARLTYHTVEVEKIINQGDKYRSVVVGKIQKIDKHPNADRLQVAQVSIGKEVLQIVCGAPNIEAGQLVPVALPGAILPASPAGGPNGAEIKEAEVRGVKSSGMLCAPDELGLGDDHSGILILKSNAKVGEPLAKHLGLHEVILEVDNKSLSNRPDLWGHEGIARELAAIFNVKFTPFVPKKPVGLKNAAMKIEVKVEAPELCPRYMAVAMTGVKVAPSPDWLKRRLSAVGMRPINNIVDITNYVMLELGQPLHAFDQKMIQEIVVRRARTGETIETLDGEKRKLTADTLVIADKHKPVAIAGVMGGASSEIGDETADIIFEAANFNYRSIRQTSTRLGLRTESSVRFEKGLDPNLAERALARAVELAVKLCPEARLASGITDLRTAASKPKQIILDLNWLERFLGAGLKPTKVEEILLNLGFTVKARENALAVTVPSWRATRDIESEVDLAEEVARIHGYDNIQGSLPQITIAPPVLDTGVSMEKTIKNNLSGAAALTEVHNYSFVGEEQLKKIFIDSSGHLRLLNPLASQHGLLRQSLVPGLLENIKTNQPRYDDIGIFEIGSVFLAAEGELARSNTGGKLPYQEKRLAIALAAGGRRDLLREVKGILENVLQLFSMAAEWRGSEINLGWTDPHGSAELWVLGKLLGTVNIMSAKAAKNCGIKKSAAIGEINLTLCATLAANQPPPAFAEYEKFPPVIRDLSFVVNEKISYSDIRREIAGFDPLIRSVELFDVYQGGKLGEKNRSLAFRIVYQADRTLVSAEADELQQRLVKRLEEKFGAKVRDF